MTIRIDRIKINRGGPLSNDFEFEPGDLNLIYGGNESGKTYVVESIIQFLFQSSSKSSTSWNIRKWEGGGRIIVSGLESDPVSFTRTNKERLDKFWTEELNFPIDLSPLMIVKAGETLLNKNEEDGVGHSILKHYLSGEGLIDNISQKISSTLQQATIQNGRVEAANRGEIKTRQECKNSLDDLNDLLEEVEEKYGSGLVSALERKKLSIETKIKESELGKYYYATQLDQKIKKLEQNQDKLPSESELSELESSTKIQETTNANRERESATLQGLEKNITDCKWAEKAVDSYSEIMSQEGVSKLNPFFIAAASLVFLGLIITGFLGLTIPFAVCILGTIGCFVFYYLRMRNALSQTGDRIELSKLEADFRSRFGSELTNKAVLEAKLEELKKDNAHSEDLKKRIEQLDTEINQQTNDIQQEFRKFGVITPEPEEWENCIQNIRNNVSQIKEEIDSLKDELNLLSVEKEKYLDQDPEIAWNADEHTSLEQQLSTIKEELSNEKEKLEHLKRRILLETQSDQGELEKLIDELQNIRDQKAEEYRSITAQILAKIQVTEILEEFRQQENERIDNSLQQPELQNSLYALTGRYNEVRQEEKGLILLTEEGEEYNLADVSTGTQEQVFLGLRLGFANTIMKGQTAFLILDDAFQHSDWSRRELLIRHMHSLAISGWQIFYFTMDNHIRDLFQKEGQKIGDRFKTYEIS